MGSLTRRNFLALAAALPLSIGLRGETPDSDDTFLEDLSYRAFLYFWDHSDPHTGLVLDRARANGDNIGGRNLEAASTAVTGFALTAMCIAAERRWMDPNRLRERVRATLRHFAYHQEHVRGWYYHFVNRSNGERVWSSELSTIDTALLLAGVVTAQQYYRDDNEIVELANGVYSRVDFGWMLDAQTGLLHMGWRPETGLLRAEWKSYDEQAILYVLGIGSPTHPIPVKSWYSFERPAVESHGYRYVGKGPLFTHQYSQAWLDLKGVRDGPPFRIDYFQNSVDATYAHRAYCLGLRGMYPNYSANLWGVTPSDSDIGYIIWGGVWELGGTHTRRDLDGTVVPCAAGGSLMFTPEICVPALRYMHEQFREHIYSRYGFVDAFNPQTLWVNPDVIGIDLGVTLLSAENLRSGNVWRWFNQSADVQRATGQIFQRY
jgi:hypothetical protein